MGAFGYIVIAVLVLAVIGGLWAARAPVRWDELGGGAPPQPPATPPTDDADELRALIEAKRAARAARGGEPTAGDRARQADVERLANGEGPAAWAHLDPELLEEARALVARRRERLTRQGKPIPDEQDELIRLLGPPHR